jgi:CHAD domain-containing protein
MPLDTELSWFAAALGEVRDLDVLGDSIAKTLWLIEDDRVRTLVSSRLERQGEGARDRLSLERSTKRYACLVDDIASIGASAQFIVTPADHAAEALRPSVEGTWDEVKRLRRKAKRDPSTDRLHRVRIELKRLQCACEVVGLVDSKEVLNVARAASSAQSRLGVVHDAAVASAWLGSLVVAEPRLKGPLGAIIRAHDDQRKDARRGWLDALAKVERRWDRWAI